MRCWLRTRTPDRPNDWVRMEWNPQTELTYLYKPDGGIQQTPYLCTPDSIAAWSKYYKGEYAEFDPEIVIDLGL